jgi:hypothetical protein
MHASFVHLHEQTREVSEERQTSLSTSGNKATYRSLRDLFHSKVCNFLGLMAVSISHILLSSKKTHFGLKHLMPERTSWNSACK